jgi:RNA polymerase sigma-70 factor, ECF subfamily
MSGIEKTWIVLEEKLRNFILSKVHDREITNDILQDVFVRVHTRIGTLRNNDKIHSWIYQITRNLITDYFRTKSGQKMEMPDTKDPDEDTDQLKLIEESVRDMVEMMDNLPPEYCEALCMTELEGMNQKDYAVKAGISYSGARSRVQRAKVILKDRLLKCCHYIFDKYGTVIEITPHCCCCSEE